MATKFHRLAVADYVSARRWYARRSPATESRFVAAVDEAVQRIEATPHLGGYSTSPFPWLRVRKFPYLLHYEVIDPQTVRVYVIGHIRRRPGYWLRRATRP